MSIACICLKFIIFVTNKPNFHTMDKFKFYRIALLALFALFLSACHSDADILNDIDEIAETEQPQGIEQDIIENIMLNRAGHFNVGAPKSRALKNVSLTPYIENGDTLLYIAQYSDGWEIYSGSKLTNMVLFSSEHGIIDLEDENVPETMRFLIEANADAISMIPKDGTPDQIHPTWGASAVTEEDLRNGKITVKVKSRSSERRAISYTDLPPGHWELVSSEVISEQTYVSPKLTITDWAQDAPWNMYAKYVKDETSTEYVQALAGCVPVAIGQYFYHTHFKDNCPTSTVTTANPINNNTDFYFTGSSTTLWDEMPLKYSYFGNYSSVALLIGDIGRKLNAQYTAIATTVVTENIAPFLKEIYGVDFPLSTFEYSYIVKSIDAQYPVIAHAWSNILNGETAKEKTGHTFLIDQYKTGSRSIKYYYVYKRDPLPPGTIDRWESDDMDEEGNIISYAYTNEVIKEQSLGNSISMNWGEGPVFNETFYSPSGDWYYADVTFNLDHKISKRQL